MGWSATQPGSAEETGGYRMFQQDGQNVGGLIDVLVPATRKVGAQIERLLGGCLRLG